MGKTFSLKNILSFAVIIYFHQTQNKQIHKIESNKIDKSFQAKVRGDHRKTSCFTVFFANVKEA